MNRTDCKLERVSNVTVGLILMGVGLLFVISGITVLPVIGLVIAAPVLVLACVFVAAPRSKACSVIVQKTRGTLSK
jgi:hypothetical protein